MVGGIFKCGQKLYTRRFTSHNINRGRNLSIRKGAFFIFHQSAAQGPCDRRAKNLEWERFKCKSQRTKQGSSTNNISFCNDSRRENSHFEEVRWQSENCSILRMPASQAAVHRPLFAGSGRTPDPPHNKKLSGISSRIVIECK